MLPSGNEKPDNTMYTCLCLSHQQRLDTQSALLCKVNSTYCTESTKF